MERELRECVKIPNMCPAEDKGQLSKGLRGEVIVHLSSINGATEDRAPLPLQATVLPLASFSATCQHLDSRLTLTARPNPFWHSCHTVHLSSDFTVALHTQASPSKRKTRLKNEHHTLPSVRIWISTSIQQVLNQFGRCTWAACSCWTWYPPERLERDTPSLLRAPGRAGRGVGMWQCLRGKTGTQGTGTQ